MAKALKVMVRPVEVGFFYVTVMGTLSDGRYFVAVDKSVPVSSVGDSVNQLTEGAEKNLLHSPTGVAITD